MSATFTLTIDLGDEGMKTGEDIAGALRRAARKLSEGYGIDYLHDWVGLGSRVTGADGRQCVGSWGINRPPAAEEVARAVLAANLGGGEEDAAASDAVLRHVDFGADRVRIMLATAARVARGEAKR